jgi:acetyl esterase
MASQEMTATKDAMFEARRAATGTPQPTVEEMREGMEVMLAALPPIDGVSTEAVEIAGLPAEWTVPTGTDAVGTILYLHGGGYFQGSIATHRRLVAALCLAGGTRGLSVDYRLAPEHPFPAGVEDALAAFRDAVAKSEELGIDPARVAVGGDSAGGHLAAVTALLAAADGGPAPAFQLLIYPATDFSETSASRLTFAEGFLLTKENMDWYEDRFLGSHADRRDPRVSPLLAGDLAGVAPAMVITAGFDPLRDEGEAYARRLREAGVPCALRRHPGSVHGFIHMLLTGSAAREALAEMGGALRGALAVVPARV